VGGEDAEDGRRWPNSEHCAGGRRLRAEQGSRDARRKKGEGMQLRTDLCSNEDGPKSKSAWFFKLYNFSLRFICI
jgi:hypothetical protein